MRSIIASITSAAVVIAGLGAYAFANPSSAQPVTKAVAISDYSFKPATISIAPGTRVVWTQKDDDPHTVTADVGKAFDSGPLDDWETAHAADALLTTLDADENDSSSR